VVGAFACAAIACGCRATRDQLPIEPDDDDQDGVPSAPDDPSMLDMPSNHAAGAGGSAGTSVESEPPSVSGSGAPQPTNDPEPTMPMAGSGSIEPTPTSSVLWARMLDDAATAYDVAINSAGHIVISAFDREGIVDENNYWFPKSLIIELDAQGEPVRRTAIDRAWVHDIELDGSDAVVMVGSAPGNSFLPNGEASGAVHTEAFVAKLTADGELAWSRRLGDDPNPLGVDQQITAVTVDGDGNVIVSGTFTGSIDFGGLVLTSTEARDLFVAKLDPAGELLWAHSFGAASDQYGGDVAIDDAGDIILIGLYTGDIDFGDGLLQAGPDSKMALAKFSPEGMLRFSRGYDQSGMWIVGADGHGSLVLVESVRNAGLSQLVRRDSAGDLLQSSELGEFGAAGSSYRAGKVALAGTTDLPGRDRPGAGVFIPDRPGIVRCDETLEPIWELHFGDGVSHAGRAVALDADGSAVMIGEIRGDIGIDGVSLAVSESQSVFIVRFAPQP
jgi:hypothetical protein